MTQVKADRCHTTGPRPHLTRRESACRSV
jgi:hypothetical protein